MIKELVVITGASSGIGEALAREFSELGHPLLLIARRIENLKAMDLPNTLCAQVDIRDRSQLKEAVDKAVAVYGDVGCLINNAGVMFLGNLGEQSPEEWEEMLDTNVIGVLNGMHTVINSMKKRKFGTIINISSVAGHKTIETASTYCASKHAVNALSETARSELAKHNIRVITIAPGGVNTKLHTHMENQDIMQGYDQWLQTIHLLSPSEVASMIVYSYKLPQHICLRHVVIAPTDQTI